MDNNTITVSIKFRDQESIVEVHGFNLDEYDEIVSDLTQFLLDH